MDRPPADSPLSAVAVDEMNNEMNTNEASQENVEVAPDRPLGSTLSAPLTPSASQESPQLEPSSLPRSTSPAPAESSNSTLPPAVEPEATQIRNEDLPKLAENQEEVMTSKLLHPIKV
jgi:hypothetical protein